MEDYQQIVERISVQLQTIVDGLSDPLSVRANDYRIVAEAICKAVIVGYGVVPVGMLDQLISTTLKTMEGREQSRDIGLFKAQIRYLQNVGNAYSHDGQGTSYSDAADQSSAFTALTKVIELAFFGDGDLDPPVLPEPMEAKFKPRLLQRTTTENPRAEEVVRLSFSKQRVETRISRADHSNRIVYDYVTADIGSKLIKGMLFIRSRTALEKTFADFLEFIGNDFPSSLSIITPRTYRSSGKEVDRRKSILDAIRSRPNEWRNRNFEVIYFDDFVWASCLPEAFREGRPPNTGATNFIPQSLEKVGQSGVANTPQIATTYIASVLDNAHDYDPLQIIIGPAGIGKTTFCDEVSNHINSKPRKRVILFSATDFRDVSSTAPIESVSDLYRLAVTNGLLDDKSAIESHNFEINLSCGNFVLIIDGFDELESHLGASLSFDSFMRSLSDLEACFRKVTVILTVRDYDIDRFKNIRQASIQRLRGFSSVDTDKYLTARLNGKQVPEARTMLASFNDISESDRVNTVPLYASLICDYLIEESSTTQISSVISSESAKFFEGNTPLDTLIRKIIDREIAKQSLGKMGPDDFFDVLIEIIRAPQLTLPAEIFASYIDGCGGDASQVVAKNFLRNPFLRWGQGSVSFKYDSLTYFFKSRLLAVKIGEGIFSEQPSIDFMSEFYMGDGPLYDEVKKVFPASDNAAKASTAKWFTALLKFGLRNSSSKLPWRKAVSAFLYWALGML